VAGIDEEAKRLVKEATPGASKLRITGRVENCLGGTLITVEYDHEEDVWNEKHVLFKDGKPDLMPNSHTLATRAAQFFPEPASVALARYLTRPEILAGLLAVVLLIVVVVYAFRSDDREAFKLLLGAFSLAVGFFFGRKSGA
jgi:hypothetical protein